METHLEITRQTKERLEMSCVPFPFVPFPFDFVDSFPARTVLHPAHLLAETSWYHQTVISARQWFKE